MIVAVDIDGILGFLAEQIAAVLNARFGTSYTPQFRQYWLESVLPPDQGRWLTAQFQLPSFYATVAPDLEGIRAVEAISAAGLPVVIVTDRPAHVRDMTVQWLAHWGVPYQDLWHDGPETKRRWAQWVAMRGETGVLLDDDPRKAQTIPVIAGNRIAVGCWLAVRPWTPGYLEGLPGVRLFRNWNQVLSWLGLRPIDARAWR